MIVGAMKVPCFVAGGRGSCPDSAAARFHRFDVVADAALGFG